MKGRSLSVLGIIAAAVGAVFIIACNTIDMHTLAIACGALFVASGLIDLVLFGAVPGDRASMSFLTTAGTIVLGVTMLVYAGDFVGMMPFMLSMLVGAAAVWQFVTLALATRPYQLPAWLYLFPLLLAAGAIYMFIIRDSGRDSLIMLSAGIALVALGAGCITEGSALGVARRRHNREAALAADTAPAQKPGESAPAAPAAPAPAPQPEKKPAKRRTETTEDLDDEVE